MEPPPFATGNSAFAISLKDSGSKVASVVVVLSTSTFPPWANSIARSRPLTSISAPSGSSCWPLCRTSPAFTRAFIHASSATADFLST